MCVCVVFCLPFACATGRGDFSPPLVGLHANPLCPGGSPTPHELNFEELA